MMIGVIAEKEGKKRRDRKMKIHNYQASGYYELIREYKKRFLGLSEQTQHKSSNLTN